MRLPSRTLLKLESDNIPVIIIAIYSITVVLQMLITAKKQYTISNTGHMMQSADTRIQFARTC